MKLKNSASRVLFFSLLFIFLLGISCTSITNSSSPSNDISEGENENLVENTGGNNEGKNEDIVTETPEEIEQPLPTATEVVEDEPEPEIGTAENPIQIFFTPSQYYEISDQVKIKIEQGLEDTIGLKFEVVIKETYVETINSLCEASDRSIGVFSPIGFVFANELCDAEAELAAVRFGGNVYWGAFFVSRDSDYNSLKDLEGAVWAYPDLGSFSGYTLPDSMFQDQGIQIETGFAAGNHGDAVLAVYNGNADVSTAFYSPLLIPGNPWHTGQDPDVPDSALSSCRPNNDGILYCGDIRVFDARSTVVNVAPDIIQEVRILALTPDIPNDTIVFSPDFPESIRQKVIQGLIDWVNSASWQETLASFYPWEGLAQIPDEAYDSMRLIVRMQELTLDDLH